MAPFTWPIVEQIMASSITGMPVVYKNELAEGHLKQLLGVSRSSSMRRCFADGSFVLRTLSQYQVITRLGMACCWKFEVS